jgi:hypothetical protein
MEYLIVKKDTMFQKMIFINWLAFMNLNSKVQKMQSSVVLIIL